MDMLQELPGGISTWGGRIPTPCRIDLRGYVKKADKDSYIKKANGSEMKHSFDLKRKNRRDLKRMNRTIGTVHSWANRPPDRRTSTLRRRLATDLARPARAFPFFLATKNHKSHKPDDLLNRAFKLFGLYD